MYSAIAINLSLSGTCMNAEIRVLNAYVFARSFRMQSVINIHTRIVH